jgi:predicted amidophosphoribosyltransferase
LKENDRRDLIVPLGLALAEAVLGVPDARAAPDGRRLLVPAPSRPAANRRRWGGHLPAVAKVCARSLCRAGHPAAVVPALRLDRRAKDSVGFDAAARRANLAGRVHVVRKALPSRGSPVILLDDVITTGATAAACTEALRRAGVRVSVTLALTAALPAR